MTDGPLQLYVEQVSSGALRADMGQKAAVMRLQDLHQRLKDYEPRGQGSFWTRLFDGGRSENGAPKGLYLYGGVGRGKSMLMDLFYAEAPLRPRRRIHFHAFMQEVHRGLDAARADNAEDPIKQVAKSIAKSAKLLCFDEMQVSDIADAMILGRLFEKLFDRGVVVVTTSNRPPKDLYKDGLQRERFVPFIKMIEERLDVFELDGPIDFRLARAHGLEVYHTPLGPAADAAMDAAFEDMTAGARPARVTLKVQGRAVVLPRATHRTARATFEDLCGQPLGPADYLAIAEAVESLFIDRIPKLGRANYDRAKRFVTLVDALYEAKTLLVCSADAPPTELYEQGEGAFEFERTASRLLEMQSADWTERKAGLGEQGVAAS